MLPQAVAFLTDTWNGTGPLDLSPVLAIVPTRQAGRRLREALAGFAAEKGQAAFPPMVLSPEAVISLGQPPDAASRLESLLAWAHVFRTLPLADFRSVFPIDPPARSFTWALRLAQEFSRLQITLAETGLRLGDVVGKAGAALPEKDRWHQLGKLEQLQAAQLATLGRRDPHAARSETGGQTPLPLGIERVVILGTPDPLPLALATVRAWSERVPVDIVVWAPSREEAAFDEWGRPQARVWTTRILDLPEFETRVHLASDPAAQAARMADLAKGYDQPEAVLALGLADPEITPCLETELTRAGRIAFNPEGRPRRQDGLFALLAALAEWAKEPSFEAAEGLARCPEWLAYRQAQEGPTFSAAPFLAGLDELRARHLPTTLEDVREHATRMTGYPSLSAGLEALVGMRTRLTQGEFAASTSAALAEIFSARRLESTREADARFEDEAVAWTAVLQECAAVAAYFPDLTRAEWWDVALRLYGDSARTDEKPAGALELQGWLELLWEDAPHLAVAGLNDGYVPEAIVGDAFVPESLRRTLGLKTNEARFARDVYILQALAASRKGPSGCPSGEPPDSQSAVTCSAGRLDLFFGRTSAEGEPLRPSRLLFRCADEALPARVTSLFHAPAMADANPSWRRAWQLTPPRVAAPPRVGVTALRTYLLCPFRFYLRHALKMESVDPAKNELDAGDFGTLCHAALEYLSRDPGLRESADPDVIRKALLLRLEQEVRARYGEVLALPLVIQLESARQRLSKAAEVQAQERAAGWLMVEVEKKFELEMAGLTVRGKIDRIDRHPTTGVIRVLDYKTSDTAVAPVDSHLRSLRLQEDVPAWAKLEGASRTRVWQDLQLPLYRRALAREYGDVSIDCGYFNLPKAASETGIVVWDGYTRELDESAQRCAEGVCAAIRAEKFWPPNETLREDYDDFAALFQRGVAASVAGMEPKAKA